MEGHVDDRRAEHLGVGHDDALVVGRVQIGRKQTNLVNFAGVARGGDDVADLERAEHQEHCARANIRQTSLKRETNRQPRCAENGGEARRGHAEDAQDRDTGDDEHQPPGGAGAELAERLVDARFLKCLEHEAAHPTGHNPRDDEQDEGANNADGPRRDEGA